MQRHDVASTLSLRCVNAMCPLGNNFKKVIFNWRFEATVITTISNMNLIVASKLSSHEWAVPLSYLSLSFISYTISSIFFLPFSGRRHKMTHKGWCVVVKPQQKKKKKKKKKKGANTLESSEQICNSLIVFVVLLFLSVPHRPVFGQPVTPHINLNKPGMGLMTTKEREI